MVWNYVLSVDFIWVIRIVFSVRLNYVILTEIWCTLNQYFFIIGNLIIWTLL